MPFRHHSKHNTISFRYFNQQESIFDLQYRTLSHHAACSVGKSISLISYWLSRAPGKTLPFPVSLLLCYQGKVIWNRACLSILTDLKVNQVHLILGHVFNLQPYICTISVFHKAFCHICISSHILASGVTYNDFRSIINIDLKLPKDFPI